MFYAAPFFRMIPSNLQFILAEATEPYRGTYIPTSRSVICISQSHTVAWSRAPAEPTAFTIVLATSEEVYQIFVLQIHVCTNDCRTQKYAGHLSKELSSQNWDLSESSTYQLPQT